MVCSLDLAHLHFYAGFSTKCLFQNLYLSDVLQVFIANRIPDCDLDDLGILP